MDPSIVTEIQKKIDQTIIGERVSIPLAVESGSRAWGFPSPDSDYDCRFVYVRRKQDYAALFQKRDVVELPLTPVFDVNGWDVQKAIKLMLKGNAVVLEWLQSPIVYRKDEKFCSLLLDLAQKIVDRSAIHSHYLHLLDGTLTRHFNAAEMPSVKKLFYVLRPAMALRQLRLNADICYPEMNMQIMMHACDLAPDIHDRIEDLLAKKAVTREMGAMAAPPQIMDFVIAELQLAKASRQTKKRLTANKTSHAEHAFRTLLDRYAHA